jgi:predicted nucleic acid-binding protein
LKERANSFLAHGIKARDALHVAAAIEEKAHFFITTDGRLLKKLAEIAKIVDGKGVKTTNARPKAKRALG